MLFGEGAGGRNLQVVGILNETSTHGEPFIPSTNYTYHQWIVMVVLRFHVIP